MVWSMKITIIVSIAFKWFYKIYITVGSILKGRVKGFLPFIDLLKEEKSCNKHFITRYKGFGTIIITHINHYEY